MPPLTQALPNPPMAPFGDRPLPSGAQPWERYQHVREHTERLAAGLSAEDQCVQSMPDASPAKWHRAHTTWFFEEFVLRPLVSDYPVYDPRYCYLFNSYYESVGPRHPRPRRGLLTRPEAAAIGRYRVHVDAHMERLLRTSPSRVVGVLELGLNHEQQHQELLITDMLHAFAQNPLTPAFHPAWREPEGDPQPVRFVSFPGGLVEIGHQGAGFVFDNETPRHQVFLAPYQLGNRLVCNKDWLDFVTDGGYRTPTLWMSDGWARVQEEGWTAPLYWREGQEGWRQMGPGGLAPLALAAPVRHISWYEADAFARWADARLPTEAEWEAAAGCDTLEGMTGQVWQWTASPYGPYPGYRPVAGAIGEYNGKFMINQMVLRGSSLATPAGHTRPSYRNFFHPDRRWQFSGLRLARDR
jgi:ergothioneine biosynthesis protein EgtB